MIPPQQGCPLACEGCGLVGLSWRSRRTLPSPTYAGPAPFLKMHNTLRKTQVAVQGGISYRMAHRHPIDNCLLSYALDATTPDPSAVKSTE